MPTVGEYVVHARTDDPLTYDYAKLDIEFLVELAKTDPLAVDELLKRGLTSDEVADLTA